MDTQEGHKDAEQEAQPEPVPQAQPQQEHHQKEQPEGPSRWTRLTSFYQQCPTVFKLTRKPTNEEYRTIVKVCAIGMAVLGALGFIISVINQLIVF